MLLLAFSSRFFIYVKCNSHAHHPPQVPLWNSAVPMASEVPRATFPGVMILLSLHCIHLFLERRDQKCSTLRYKFVLQQELLLCTSSTAQVCNWQGLRRGRKQQPPTFRVLPAMMPVSSAGSYLHIRYFGLVFCWVAFFFSFSAFYFSFIFFSWPLS